MMQVKEEPLGKEHYSSCSATLKMNLKFQVFTTLVSLETKHSYNINQK